MTRRVLVAGAWPYANGSLHLGHVAALLPGDIIARYHRAIGDEVCFVSGTDCHGTPITVRAEAEGVGPEVVAGRYHEEFSRDFERLGISYDLYTSTLDGFHKAEVQIAFRALIEDGWLIPKVTDQTYCTSCARFLPDRYVDGACPACGDAGARGDQCDACGTMLAPTDLLRPRCRFCGAAPEQRPTEHLYFQLERLQPELQALLDSPEAQYWRPNARGLTARYLAEGLIDRAATRDIDWGIEVPLDGYEGKRVYVWFEAVMGYLTATKRLFLDTPAPDAWHAFWDSGDPDLISYYIHGKDNIPFHTLIWPALLLALGNLHLPDRIVSSEHLTLEGRKFSTSGNWAVWVPDFLSRYDADPLRYFLTANGPESRDADFSWREFVERNNGELLGGYGNFVHRSLAFIGKYLGGCIPQEELLSLSDEGLIAQGDALFPATGALIEEGKLKEALRGIFEYVHTCNRYFDVETPWVTVDTDRARCHATLYTCAQAIGHLCQLLAPFLPFSSERIRRTLNAPDSGWGPLRLSYGQPIGNSQPPFRRLDKSVVAEEVARLGRI